MKKNSVDLAISLLTVISIVLFIYVVVCLQEEDAIMLLVLYVSILAMLFVCGIIQLSAIISKISKNKKVDDEAKENRAQIVDEKPKNKIKSNETKLNKVNNKSKNINSKTK